MEQLKGGVWVKASKLKEIDWPLCIRYDGGGAYYYTTVSSIGELHTHISEINPIEEIEYLNESAFKDLVPEDKARSAQETVDETYEQTNLQNKIFELEKKLNEQK